MTKVCPRCNKTFDCQHSKDCWCSKYVLSERAKNFLQSQYENCLCEDCLKSIAQEYK